MKKAFVVLSILATGSVIAVALASRDDPAPTPLGESGEAETPAATWVVTATSGGRRAAILEEIHQIADEYNRLVAGLEELAHETVTPATTGGAPTYFDTSGSPLFSAWDDLVMRVQGLNQEYFQLFADQFSPLVYPVPDPRPDSEAAIRLMLDEAGADYRSWLEEEMRTGSFITLEFDPYERRRQVILVGDSYIRENLRWQAFLQFRLSLLAPTAEELEQDIELIGRLFSAEVALEDVGVLLPMYTDHQLRQYSAGDWRVLLDPSADRIMLIMPTGSVPTRSPQGTTGPRTRLTQQALEERAVEWVELAAPGTDLSLLTPLINQKGDNYFFRWEDRTRPLLPDGRSLPFVQVALDIFGDLLNYYNTL